MPIKPLPPLEDWLARNLAEIEELVGFTRTHCDPAPDTLNEFAADVNAKSAAAGYLLADAENYLVTAKALAIREMDEDLGPTAQKAFIEDRTKDIRRLRDQLRVAGRSLKSMSINACSIRKAQRPT